MPGKTSVLDSIPPGMKLELVNGLMKQHSDNTAISFMPTLPLPNGVMDSSVAEEHISHLRDLSSGIGPVVLLQAVQKVVSEDL